MNDHLLRHQIQAAGAAMRACGALQEPTHGYETTCPPTERHPRMPEAINTIGLKFTLAEPPEPFTDDFPMVSEYYLIQPEGYNPFVYVPEDGELIKGDAALQWIYRCAPLTTFVGAVEVRVNLP